MDGRRIGARGIRKKRWKRYRTFFFMLSLAAVFSIFLPPSLAVMAAAGDSGGESITAQEPSDEENEVLSGLSELDFSKVEEFLKKNQRESGDFSFEELLRTILKGDLKGAFSQSLSGLRESLFSELSSGTRLMAQVLLISMSGAVFSCFSGIFAGGQISETAFYVTFLLLFSLLASSFYTSISIASDAIFNVLDFMKALTPCYFMAMSLAGSSLSAAAGCEWMLLSITAVEWMLSSLLLPLLKVYILLVLAGHLTKEELFSRMTGLIKHVIEWGLKTLTGIILGFHLLQGMVLPCADSIKNESLQRMISLIPGIGQGASTISQMVLGSGILIKNAVGVAGTAVLLILTAVPLLKLFLLMVLHHCLAAVAEPVCDKRIVSCISDMGKGHQLLLCLVVTSLFLFIVSLGIICMTSNGG